MPAVADVHCKAVVFDLFGTLVEDIQATIHERMAELLGLPTELFLEHWLPGYEARGKGVKTFEECVAEMSETLHLSLEHGVVEAIAKVRTDALAEHLQRVKPGALATLERLTAAGFPLALVSNASVEVHAGWDSSPVSSWFPSPIFSCDVHLMKPDPAIYLLACNQLDVPPSRCLFVGDGGDNELSGAMQVGMTTVQVPSYRERIPDADYSVASLDEMGALLRSLEYSGHG